MPITEITEICRLETESLADIEANLEGTVFHVTKREYWHAILAAGELLPNQGRSLPTSFGPYDSFFRNLGCVCVFDYRTRPDDSIVDFRRRCYPFQPASPGNDGIAIFVLNPSVYPRLLPWTLWEEQQAWSQMVVPHVEAGYPGPISLELVDRVIMLRCDEDARSHAAIIRRSMRQENAG